jgi:L-lactate dehydrogenase complex protein LldE
MPKKKVYLFTTCLVDQVFPQVGAAVVRLLRQTGCEVIYPESQVCCGQPFYNSGYHQEAKKLARQTIMALKGADAVVIPSGSCTAMIRHEYPKLFFDDPEIGAEVNLLAEKTFELSEFLVETPALFDSFVSKNRGVVTYHDSCHMRRGLGVWQPPRQLLAAAGYQILEMEDSERCCGFGGVFYVRMPEISGAMAERKMQRVKESGAQVVVTADPGCMMRMQQEHGHIAQIKHIAELLDEALQ